MRDSKITFRVSDDLLERVDAVDESRSEIMREALRAYLDGGASTANPTGARPEGRKTRATFDNVLRGMVEEVVKETVETESRDNVNVTVNIPESERRPSRRTREKDAGQKRVREGRAEEETPVSDDEGARKTACAQCGEELEDGHVYCPNCGEKAARRVFCDCGDEIRTDWSFCPSCGRRTPASHALNR